GKLLLLGTVGGLIHRWDLKAMKELPPLGKHAARVTAMHVLPDGQTLVSTGRDGIIRRWDLRTGVALAEPASYAGTMRAAYSSKGGLVALGDRAGRLDLWDASSGKLLRALRRTGE